MLDFLIIYISIALFLFAASVFITKQGCKEKNAELSRPCFRVNYKGCFVKSLFFPLTIANMLYELIRKE